MRKILLGCALAVAVSCADQVPEEESATPPSPVVARVDGHAITQADVERRLRVTRIYYPQADAGAALAELIEGRLAIAVLGARGVELDWAEIAAEAARIDRDTRWPARLAEIRAALGDNYDELFVLPLLARTRLAQEMARDPLRMAGARHEADALVTAAAGDDDAWQAAVRDTHAESARLARDGTDGWLRPDTGDRIGPLPEIELRLRDLAGDRTIELEDGILIIRGETAGGALDLARVPAPDATTWGFAQARAIPIQVNLAAHPALQRISWLSDLDVRPLAEGGDR